MTEEEYLQERLYAQIDWYDHKSGVNQKWWKFCRTVELALAIITPFLIGYVPQYVALAPVVGAFAVVVAMCAGATSLYGFHEKWIEYRTLCESLKLEKHMYLTRTGKYSGDNPFVALVETVESKISRENTKWLEIHQIKKEA